MVWPSQAVDRKLASQGILLGVDTEFNALQFISLDEGSFRYSFDNESLTRKTDLFKYNNFGGHTFPGKRNTRSYTLITRMIAVRPAVKRFKVFIPVSRYCPRFCIMVPENGVS